MKVQREPLVVSTVKNLTFADLVSIVGKNVAVTVRGIGPWGEREYAWAGTADGVYLTEERGAVSLRGGLTASFEGDESIVTIRALIRTEGAA